MATDANEYWNRGVANVIDMTGARLVMDASDFKELFYDFGVELPLKNVLDVGCGSGRAHQISDGYLGMDVSVSAVDFCRLHGIPVKQIATQTDVLTGLTFMPNWILCISVFTHIDEANRRRYLEVFRQTGAANLLVDVIPGDGSGDVELWTAEIENFEDELLLNGWDVNGTSLRTWDAGFAENDHRYYYCNRI